MKRKKNKNSSFLFEIFDDPSYISDYLKAEYIFSEDLSEKLETLINQDGFKQTLDGLNILWHKSKKYLLLKLLNIEFDLLRKQSENADKDEINEKRIEDFKETIKFLFENAITMQNKMEVDDTSLHRYFYLFIDYGLNIKELEDYIERCFANLFYIVSGISTIDNETANFYLPIVLYRAKKEVLIGKFENLNLFMYTYCNNLNHSPLSNCTLLLLAFTFYYYTHIKCNDEEYLTLKNHIEGFITYRNIISGKNYYSFKDAIILLLNEFDISYFNFRYNLEKIKRICDISDLPIINEERIEFEDLALNFYTDYLIASNVEKYDNFLTNFKIDKKDVFLNLLKKIRNRYFKEDSNELNSEKLDRNFISFCCGEEITFENFISRENEKHCLFNFINENLKNEIYQILNYYDRYFDGNYLNNLSDSLNDSFKEFYGYSSRVKRSVEPVSLYVKDELLIPDNFNIIQIKSKEAFKPLFTNCINISKKIELKIKSSFIKNIVKPIIIDKNFDKNIEEITRNKVSFIENGIEFLTNNIVDQELKAKFESSYEKAIKESYLKTLFYPNTIILNNGFEFFIEYMPSYYENVSDDDINNELAKLKKIDENRYIFEDCIFEENEIKDILKIKLRKFKVDIKFYCKFNKGDIITFYY